MFFLLLIKFHLNPFSYHQTVKNGQIIQITFRKIEQPRLCTKTVPVLGLLNLDLAAHVVSANLPKLETGEQKRTNFLKRT